MELYFFLIGIEIENYQQYFLEVSLLHGSQLELQACSPHVYVFWYQSIFPVREVVLHCLLRKFRYPTVLTLIATCCFLKGPTIDVVRVLKIHMCVSRSITKPVPVIGHALQNNIMSNLLASIKAGTVCFTHLFAISSSSNISKFW